MQRVINISGGKTSAYMTIKEYKEGLQIDRINNDGNYEPSNCRFVTRIENMANRSVTKWVVINGEKKTLIEWSKISGIQYSTIQYRIKNGWNENKFLKAV